MASPACSENGAAGDFPVSHDTSKGVKHLVDSNPSLQAIPPDCVLPVDTMSEPVAHRSVPVIDLRGLDDPSSRARTVDEIASACVEWGFFCAVNHGFNTTLMEAMLRVVEAFFSLPLVEKMAHSSDDVMRQVLYGSNLNACVGPHGHHWRDFLRHYGRPFNNNGFHLWPTDPPEYRHVAKEYLEEAWRLAMRLAGAISEGLALEAGYMEGVFGEGSQIVVCNYYPPCPQPDLTLGLSGHTDRGGITILMENGVEGLQVRCHGKWVPVPHVPGSFMVNIGDCIEILSNGKCKSVEHRAVVNKKRARITVAVGNGPAYEELIAPAAHLVDEGGGPNYKPILFKELRFRDSMSAAEVTSVGSPSARTIIGR